jgi:hypothetical protein
MAALSARQIARLRRDRRGNVGMIGAIGCGVDYGPQSLVLTRLNTAADGSIAKSSHAWRAQKG